MKCLLFSVAICVTSFTLHAAPLPVAIASLLPSGYEPMTFRAGPRIEGNRRSFLVVVHRSEDSEDHPSPRPLLIFEEQEGGAYRLAARNDMAVLRANEGGQCDPFENGYDGLAMKGHYFTVQNAVACGDHWTDFITFRYEASHREWLFVSEIFTSSDPLNGTPDKVDVKHAKGDKPIAFQDWYPTR